MGTFLCPADLMDFQRDEMLKAVFRGKGAGLKETSVVPSSWSLPMLRFIEISQMETRLKRISCSDLGLPLPKEPHPIDAGPVIELVFLRHTGASMKMCIAAFAHTQAIPCIPNLHCLRAVRQNRLPS